MATNLKSMLITLRIPVIFFSIFVISLFIIALAISSSQQITFSHNFIFTNTTNTFNNTPVKNTPNYSVLNKTNTSLIKNTNNSSITNFNIPTPFSTPTSYTGPIENAFYFLSGLFNKNVISVGISSFGINNIINNNPVGYIINTDQVNGNFDITSMQVSSVETAQGNVISNPYWDSGMQLNARLVFDYGGNPHSYWLQNTVTFSTTTNKFFVCNNIWNTDSNTANINLNPVTGIFSGDNGNLGSYDGVMFYYKCLQPAYYNLPFNGVLGIKIDSIGTGSSATTGIIFQYAINKNGNIDPVDCLLLGNNCNNLNNQKDVIYDTVLLPPGSTNAAIVISPELPSEIVPSSLNFPYSAELEIGGATYSQITAFSSFNAQLGLKYDSNGNENMVNFPSYWTFGVTAESTSNLVSTINAAGQATITTTNTGINPLSGITTSCNLLQLEASNLFLECSG